MTDKRRMNSKSFIESDDGILSHQDDSSLCSQLDPSYVLEASLLGDSFSPYKSQGGFISESDREGE